MYETFDHTADLGLRVRAADLNTLFAESARALFSVIVANLADVSPVQRVEIELEEDQPDFLLFDWLNELLFLYDSRNFGFSDFQVTINDGHLTGSAGGEPLDSRRHQLDHEVKAITYHGLKVQPDPTGWLAEFIVDI